MFIKKPYWGNWVLRHCLKGFSLFLWWLCLQKFLRHQMRFVRIWCLSKWDCHVDGWVSGLKIFVTNFAPIWLLDVFSDGQRRAFLYLEVAFCNSWYAHWQFWKVYTRHAFTNHKVCGNIKAKEWPTEVHLWLLRGMQMLKRGLLEWLRESNETFWIKNVFDYKLSTR